MPLPLCGISYWGGVISPEAGAIKTGEMSIPGTWEADAFCDAQLELLYRFGINPALQRYCVATSGQQG
jgi:hypothetical protein